MDWLYGNRYRLWVINTTSQAFLYTWERWSLLLPGMDSIVKPSKDLAYIRTFQCFEPENKWLGFGRMQWSEENNRKWTAKYRSEEYSAKTWAFFNTQIWAPDWNLCYDKGITPQLFIMVYHYPTLEKIREGIVIAFPKKIAEKNAVIITSNLKNLLSLIPGATLSAVNRSWTSCRKFPNRIEDINSWELEKLIYQP
jgi:hypothetical protein